MLRTFSAKSTFPSLSIDAYSDSFFLFFSKGTKPKKANPNFFSKSSDDFTVWSKNSIKNTMSNPTTAPPINPTTKLINLRGRTGTLGNTAGSTIRTLLPENCPDSSILILCTRRRVSTAICVLVAASCRLTETTSGC